MNRWEIPFTPAQVAALQEYQRTAVNPYGCYASNHKPLVPTESGWYCEGSGKPRDWCEYTLNWAYEIPVTFKHELVAAGLVSHRFYVTDDPYPSIKVHSSEEAAVIAIEVLVKYLRRLAAEEDTAHFQAEHLADYLRGLADGFADLV